jgi:hypothetical protein
VKNFTKIIIGAGIAGAALIGAAAPATAAPTANAAAPKAAGETVLQGKFKIYVPRSDAVVNLGFTASGYISYNSMVQPTVQVPLPGHYGKIRILDGAYAGKCLSWYEPNPSGSGAVAANCTDPTTDMYIETDGRIMNKAKNTFYDLVRFDPSYSGSYNSKFRLSEYTQVTLPAPVTPVDITGPTAGSTVDTKKPTFTGTGEPGAAIVLKDDKGNTVGTGTVGSDGKWSIPSTVDFPDGPAKVTAEQTASDGTKTSDDVSFIVADSEDTPVINPGIAAGALGMALLAGAGFVARRRLA